MTTLQQLRAHPTGTTAATVLTIAILSLLTNITTKAQLSGNADALFFLRLIASKLLNSGTLWAGI